MFRPVGDVNASLPPPDSSEIYVRRAVLDEVDALTAIARREVGPTTAPADVVRRVMSHNTEGFFTVLHARPGPMPAEIIGFYGYLMLNLPGVEAILSGGFDGLGPDLSMLCSERDTPAALYGWCAVARGVNKWARPLVMKQLSGPRYQGLDFYYRAVTEDGLRAIIKLGCVPARPGEAPARGCIMVKRANPAAKAA